MAPKLPAVRRIVTAEIDEGAGSVVSDSRLDGGRAVADGVVARHLWATAAAPVAYESHDDGAGLLAGTPPPPAGSRVGALDIAPGAVAGALHRTDTLDYAICVLGEITLVTPGDRRTLQPGDVVVQCGATHTWANDSAAPARLVFVMIDAGPKRPGSLGATTRV